MNIYKYYMIVLFIALLIMITAFVYALVKHYKQTKIIKENNIFGKDLYD